MQLQIQQKQNLQLNPRMEMSLSILGLDELELLDYLEDYSAQNPLVDIDLAGDILSAEQLLAKKMEWLSEEREREPGISRDEEDFSLEANLAQTAENAYTVLSNQLGEIKLPKRIRACAQYLLDYLDEDGLLAVGLQTLAEKPYSMSELQEALRIIQEMDPPGVGAENLQQCLVLQLARQGLLTELRTEIIEKYLLELCKGKFQQIAGQLGIDEKTLRAEYDLIKTLNPRPCAALNTDDTQKYIRPDLFVHCEHGEPVLELNEYVPTISINKTYIRMLKQTKNREVAEYLSKHLNSAKWLMSCLEKRRHTMHAVAETIVELQRKFFLSGPQQLRPMRMADIAQRVGMHESTVSRAVRGKYVQTDFGVFELRRLFQGNKGSNKGHCADPVKHEISRMIAQEDGAHPLSDQEISDRLKQRGMQVSRRTVTKYREQMNIVSSRYRHK